MLKMSLRNIQVVSLLTRWKGTAIRGVHKQKKRVIWSKELGSHWTNFTKGHQKSIQKRL